MKPLKAKIKESLIAVLPVTIIVLILNYTIAPVEYGSLLLFIVSSFILIIGMGFFALGADTAMITIGENIGSYLSRSRKLWLILLCGFLIGAFVTIAEPDLTILAELVPAVEDATLILAVAFGVGVFLLISFLKTIFNWKLSYLLIGFYLLIFIIAAFIPKDFIGTAFDSGGVTTGPITVPFIIALGVGVTSVRASKGSGEDSFGFVALCSIGPILAVLILAIVSGGSSGEIPEAEVIPQITNLNDVLYLYFDELPHTFAKVALALSPIAFMFIIFQIFALKLSVKKLITIAIGFVYTYLGLVLFLTSAEVGFIPVGQLMGEEIAGGEHSWLIIPIGLIMGFVVVLAEPAVHVLVKEVEEVSEGDISKNSLLVCLTIGVAISVSLSMLRVYTGLSIWWILIPGYAIALILSLIVPPLYTAIAFDSGGVASGPMTSTFLLAFALGASRVIPGSSILTDAFGLVAFVAMTPLVTIQVMGLVVLLKNKRTTKTSDVIEIHEIIDLDWEQCFY